MFIEKYRNLTFLEQQLEEYSRAEQDRFEVSKSISYLSQLSLFNL